MPRGMDPAPPGVLPASPHPECCLQGQHHQVMGALGSGHHRRVTGAFFSLQTPLHSWRGCWEGQQLPQCWAFQQVGPCYTCFWADHRDFGFSRVLAGAFAPVECVRCLGAEVRARQAAPHYPSWGAQYPVESHPQRCWAPATLVLGHSPDSLSLFPGLRGPHVHGVPCVHGIPCVHGVPHVHGILCV